MVLDTALGRFHVAGTSDPSLSWEELAARAPATTSRLGELKVADEFGAPPTFPFGAHIAVVEVDIETGKVELQRFIAVDDAGTLINPLLAEGQVHGGVATGVAQALWEDFRYDEDGTPLSSTLRQLWLPLGRRAAVVGDGRDGDADAEQPAGREGDRRVGDDRLDTGRPQRRARRARAVRCEARRPALQRRERLAGNPGGEVVTKIALTVNGVQHEAEVEPRQLLVYFLREQLGLKGTNVGCDTSSCGACTVLLDGESVKSCNVLAVQADGGEMTTIEGLAPGDELHPVQQAFHEKHALQCGYCTPGFVMATVSLLKENPNPSEEEIRVGLEGNLCRCTGYHNIVRAVRGGGEGAGVIPAGFEYERAGSLDEAIELLGREDAKVLAGGQSLIPLLRLRFARPSVLVDIGRLDDLRYVREDGDRIAIGALTRHPSSSRDPVLGAGCAIISHAAKHVGDPQVRHRGTIGGSVAHGDPASDLGTILLTLDAELVAHGPDGERTIPAADFFLGPFMTALGPRDVLTEIRVPKVERGVYVKHNRRSQDWATVGVAAADVDGARAGRAREHGGTPLRARAVEEAIAGGASPADAAERAAEGTEPPGDVSGSSEYRAHLAQVLVRRALEQL